MYFLSFGVNYNFDNDCGSDRTDLNWTEFWAATVLWVLPIYLLSSACHFTVDQLITKQGQQPHHAEDWLFYEFHMSWLWMVHLETGQECALTEVIRRIADEAIVIAQHRVAADR